MPDLLSLPNELLLLISYNTYRDDIESFTISCKNIFAVSRDILEEHRSRKRYNKITLHAVFYKEMAGLPEFQDNHPGQLLIEFLADPQILPYVSTMNVVAHISYDRFAFDDGDTKHHAIDGGEKDESHDGKRDLIRKRSVMLKELLLSHRVYIRDLLDNLTCVQDQDEADRVCEKVIFGNQAATLGLIISMLPALHHLKFEGFMLENGILNKMLRNMMIASHKDKIRSKALSRVTTLDINRHSSLSLDLSGFVRSLVQLPSLEKFCGANLPMNCHISGCNDAKRISPLKVIELDHCSTDITPDANIFGKCTSLKEFRYRKSIEHRYFRHLTLRLYSSGSSSTLPIH